MKTEKLKEGIRYDISPKKYTKSKMYEFNFSVDILVEEKQENGSKDQTFLHYELSEGDKAYFSEEYLPVGMRKEGVKKPDITAIIEDPIRKKMKWFIYDMKDTITKIKVAGKLCNQWHEGIEHISKEYLVEKSEYLIDNSIGVITRYWDKDLLRQEIDTYRERLNNKNGLLTAKKYLIKAPEYREKIRAAQNIIDGVYEDYDEVAGEKKRYTIQYISLDQKTDLLYTAHVDIHL